MSSRIKNEIKIQKILKTIVPKKAPFSYESCRQTFRPKKNFGSQNQHTKQNITAPPVRRRIFAGVSVTSLLQHVGFTPVSYRTASANEVMSLDWEKISLPISDEIVLLDICFVDNNRGFLVGTRQTLLETKDGGKTWTSCSVPAASDERANYRFNAISFKDNEGWIVGKPPIVLYTKDTGKTWERVPLSARLPGNALKITATSKEQAEMITDQGAIYITSDAGQSWQAAVQETVDATLNRTVSSGINGASFFEGYFSNVARDENGRYVAVSSRGNFFMTWSPGDTNWTPHNRPTGRRIQNMGWKSKKLWLTTRGGQVLLGKTEEDFEDFTATKLQSRGFGILDLDFKTDYLGYACGGSGSLYKTEDGGTYWKRDKSADDLAGNLYTVKFAADQVGFILGNNGILLRYVGRNTSQ